MEVDTVLVCPLSMSLLVCLGVVEKQKVDQLIAQNLIFDILEPYGIGYALRKSNY